MKKFLLLLFVLIVFLSGCSSAAEIRNGDGVASAQQPSPVVTATLEVPTDDPIISGMRISFSGGAHAKQLTCETCHATPAAAEQKQLSWLNAATGQSEPVATPTELCVKCHTRQQAANSPAGSAQVAHKEFGCTTCHNAHTAQASCTQSACHSDIRNTMTAIVKKPATHPSSGDPNNYMCGGSACHALAKQALAAPIYHQPAHGNVPCYICHDISGTPVMLDDNQNWVMIDPSGQDTSSPSGKYVSHLIGREVDCSKCHYANNPLNLVVISSSH